MIEKISREECPIKALPYSRSPAPIITPSKLVTLEPSINKGIGENKPLEIMHPRVVYQSSTNFLRDASYFIKIANM